MKKSLAVGLLLALGGCASHHNPCNDPGTMDSSQCQSQQLLYENDLMQAKILVTSGDKESLDLASALLDRIQPLDEEKRGEADLYRALILIRRTPKDTQAIMFYLERAASRRNAHALALLYRMHYDPYLLPERNLEKADIYRKRYAQLDVARSGYPSFDQAVDVVDVSRLFAVPLDSKAPAPAAVAPTPPAPQATAPAPAATPPVTAETKTKKPTKKKSKAVKAAAKPS